MSPLLALGRVLSRVSQTVSCQLVASVGDEPLVRHRETHFDLRAVHGLCRATTVLVTRSDSGTGST